MLGRSGFAKSVLRGRFVSTWSVHVTDSARRRFDEIMKTKGFAPEKGSICISTKQSGCAGRSYKIQVLAEEPVKETHSPVAPKVFVAKADLASMVGLEIDWKESDCESKFVFVNPNATSTCPCGKSFAI